MRFKSWKYSGLVVTQPDGSTIYTDCTTGETHIIPALDTGSTGSGGTDSNNQLGDLTETNNLLSSIKNALTAYNSADYTVNDDLFSTDFLTDIDDSYINSVPETSLQKLTKF